MGQSQFVVFVLIWILFSLFKAYNYIPAQPHPRHYQPAPAIGKYIIYSSDRIDCAPAMTSDFADIYRSALRGTVN